MKHMLYKDDAVTFDVTIGPHKSGERITITRSHDECWTSCCRGEEVARLTDHGNGVKIKLEDGKKLDLDYGELFALKMILDGYHLDTNSNMGGPVDRYELKED